MKTFLLILFLSFFTVKPDNPDIIDYILGLKPVLIERMDISSKENKVFVPMEFASAAIVNSREILQLKNDVILKIELVYTVSPQTNVNEQKELNRQRLVALQKTASFLFQNDLIEWSLVAQTKAVVVGGPEKLFHGFVISFRPRPSKENTETEIAYIKKMIENTKLSDITFSGSALRDSLNMEEMKRKALIEDIKKMRAPEDMTIKRGDISGIYRSFDFSKNEYYKPEPIVFKVCERNKEWKNMLVVCDFTGSMAPYTSQVLVWHKLNFKTNKERIKLFAFFNDGDFKPDNEKIIGKTGGIYSGKVEKFEDLENLAYLTMKSGIGGSDIPENNIEALIESINKCPECEDIIMIADNFATPRDMVLLSRVTKPIHIILCGTKGGVNPAYLTIALETKGTLHTMEEDIENLAALNEGDEIKIGVKRYKIKNGTFVMEIN